MKRFLKYLGRTFLAIFVLLLLVVFLIYLPPVQNFIKNKVVCYVSENYGITLGIERFRLEFPADLVLEDVYWGSSPSDTLLVLKSLHLDVGLGRIFRRQLSVKDLTVKGVKFGSVNDSSGMKLQVDVDEAVLKAEHVDLKEQWVEVDFIGLNRGKVLLVTGKETLSDTVAPKPLNWIFKVGRIDLQQVDYQMSAQGLPSLTAGVRKGDIVQVTVNLERQVVDVDSLCISGGNCHILKAGAADGKPENNVLPDTVQILPWTLRAGCLQVDNSAFSMEDGTAGTAELVLSGIGVRLDSVYNQGTVVRAQLKDLKAVQQDGITVTTMQADVGLDSARTWLQGGYIRTLNSWLRLEVFSNTNLQHLMKREPLSVRMTGQVGIADVLPFYPDIPEGIRNEVLHVNTVFSVTEKRLQVGQLMLDMAGRFKFTGSGSLSSFQNPDKMKGTFILRGEMPDVTFAQVFLKDSVVQIPRGIDMLARLKAERGTMTGLLRLCTGQGCLSLDASYGIRQQKYDAELTVNQFPLDRFLPNDSLGVLSSAFRFSGRAFTWKEAEAEMDAHIRLLEYRGYSYEDITLSASLDRTRLKGTLTSRDTGIPLDLVFRGDSVEQEYMFSLYGKLGQADFQRLRLVNEPLTAGTDIELQAAMGKEEAYTLQLRLDSLRMSDARKNYVLGNLMLDGMSNVNKTELKVVSGDLKLEFRTDTSVSAFVNSSGKVAGVIQQQIKDRNVNMELVREDLPPFSLQITGAQNNAVTRFLKSRNMGFKQLTADVVSRKRNGIRVGFIANAPYFGEVRLDSVQLGAWQTGKSLVYSFAAGSSSEAWKGLFNISVNGRMQEDHFRMELKQKDAQGKVGFDLGINTVIGDTSVAVSFFPMNPILGYSRWIVNADNRVVIGPHGRIRANLNMAYQNKLVHIQSLEDEGNQHERLRVEMAGLDLAGLSRMVPFMPQLNGVLNTALLLYSQPQEMGVDGNVRIVELGYEQQRIGTLDLGLKYVAGNRFSDHAVRFELKIDSVRRALAEGTFSTSEADRSVEMDVDIPSFPLYIVNAFVPAGVMRLGGGLTGNVRFRGTIDAPQINGNLAFRGGKADVVMLGTVFRLDSTRIDVKDGRVLFRKYRFFAPDNSSLVLNGYVALTPFAQMNMNVSVDARNFELVNVRKNETSLIYGKAYADIRARIAGLFSNLSVSGNANLQNQTDITYTLRSSDPAIVDKSVDLVRFVSFRDSTFHEKDELTNRVNASSFSFRMLVEIGDEVKLGVDLSDDGNNHVNIQGGGNLVLAMNPESGMTLSGKYILTGGTVEYNVPIVGKKEFNIRNGSFVEWTGNVMNPALSISALSQVKADVEEGEQARQVVFEAIIRIQNTLNRPDITFDLSAPNDMVIQNQLATFSPEERTRQALNLLIYNTYTAPGAVKSNGNSNLANNAIYSFVENELNKYTRKAGLTVGFDSHNTDENTSRTDVTYQFSRQLFNDRVRVKIGGRISTDSNEGQGNNTLQDNLVDDISIEYVLTRKRNLYVKVFRHSNYESVLDGEVTQTGVGIVWRKNFRKFKDLFKNKNREEQRAKKLEEGGEG